MSGREDAEESRRAYGAPYSKHRTIPTIRSYQEEKAAREARAALNDEGPNNEQSSEDDEIEDSPGSTRERAKQNWYSYWYGESKTEDKASNDAKQAADDKQEHDAAVKVHSVGEGNEEISDNEKEAKTGQEQESGGLEDTSEVVRPTKKDKRKNKGFKRTHRKVTDPVTHLPVEISDFTQKSLKAIEENPPPWGATLRTVTGLGNKKKTNEQLSDEIREMQKGHESMEALFPPPHFDEFRIEIIHMVKIGMTLGLLGCAAILLGLFGIEIFLIDNHKPTWLFGVSTWLVLSVSGLAPILFWISTVRGWMANRIRDVWASQVWEANRESIMHSEKAKETESVVWFNSLVSSVWPLINPDLFTSLADMVEDVMQASLPKFVQMVSVEDIGQGTEALRILGVRWLPSGAASRSVGEDGELEASDGKKQPHGARQANGEGKANDEASTTHHDDKDGNNKDGSQPEDGSQKIQVAEGMEAEEGDFINLEVSFAYRARPAQSLQDRSKDIHMLLAFYLPGNIKIPIWVDVRGIIGIVRLRLQLTPDPPFFALCTLTFLGQPRVDISCIPLIAYGPNIMDLPLIKNFVQGSVDAAVAEYVAPKSLTLDLKDMLAGDDFKKDTHARGILVVHIKSGHDFKFGDAAIPLIRDAGADPYVSVGFAKFGKPLWSTRVLQKEMNPVWQETCYLLVSPEELDVNERLRIQLWDSDRFTPDDDLGRIELDLKRLMSSDESNGKMHDRSDGFRALSAEDEMPGQLEWSVGYFAKARLQDCQFQKQTYDPEIRSMTQLEKKVEHISHRKLREAQVKKGRHAKTDEELKQLKVQELKTRQDAIMMSAPPPDDYPSGIFSIQVHQITELEYANINTAENNGISAVDDEDVQEGQGLPSAYCNIIINHNKVYKTRTKPKSAHPYMNAGTERFVPDWRNAQVFVSVRDQRVGEDDPLLGIVRLRLGEVFAKRSQVNGRWPLTGGIGYGRIRISMVWRSVQLQSPQKSLGWDYGTLQIKPQITCDRVADDLKSLEMVLETTLSRGKMHAKSDRTGWFRRKDNILELAVQRRYSRCLTVRFKHKTTIKKDRTHAFAILWLKDIPDDEEQTLKLTVWKGDFERAKACTLEECGENVGEIEITLTFKSGLGDAHSKWARKDPNLRNVMEVIDVAHDNFKTKRLERLTGIADSSEESGDESDPEGGDQGDGNDHSEDQREATSLRGSEVEHEPDAEHQGEDYAGEIHREEESHESRHDESEKMTIIDKIRDYKDNAKQEHRQNKGIMQYKVPRTAKWAVHKAGRVESKITGIFKHHTREPDIETEV